MQANIVIIIFSKIYFELETSS